MLLIAKGITHWYWRINQWLKIKIVI